MCSSVVACCGSIVSSCVVSGSVLSVGLEMVSGWSEMVCSVEWDREMLVRTWMRSSFEQACVCWMQIWLQFLGKVPCDCWLSSVVCCLLLCCLLLCCLLFAVCCLLSVVCCLLFAVCCLLFVVFVVCFVFLFVS